MLRNIFCYFSMIKENYTSPAKHNIELKVKQEKDLSRQIVL